MTDERSEWEEFAEVSLPRMLAGMSETNEFTFRAEPLGGWYVPENPLYDFRIREWWEYPDTPFRNYTPFPRLDAAERKARAVATEGRERLSAAWKVLRSGDRDPFGEGCDCW